MIAFVRPTAWKRLQQGERRGEFRLFDPPANRDPTVAQPAGPFRSGALREHSSKGSAMGTMPQDPVGDDEYIELVPIPTTRVARFLLRAFLFTRPEDLPFQDEWEAWASRFESLEEAWDTCKDPELLLVFYEFSSGASADSDRTRQVWDAFTPACLASANLSEGAIQIERSSELESDMTAWFGPDSDLPVARARRAVLRALEAREERGESRAEVKAELASIFKDLVGNPFVGSTEPSDSQTFWKVGGSQ
jgi:hypothetical protein